ncbi:MAG: hypothetical protein AAGJ52_13985 [Pseudomonadota bacterium]
MTERRAMGLGDWLNAAVNFVIGVLLGIAADGLLQLASSGQWFLALLIPVLFAGWFLFMLLLDKGMDRLFPSGIRPAKTSKEKAPMPLPRLLGLPAGAVAGVVLARLGLAAPLLNLLP